jgi:hypothetical protein
MSRSYKKHPCHKDQDTYTKRKFNRSIRRTCKTQIAGCRDFDEYIEEQSGYAYKRLNCSWDICDYKSIYYTKGDFEWVFWMWPDDEEKQNKEIYQARMK